MQARLHGGKVDVPDCMAKKLMYVPVEELMYLPIRTSFTLFTYYVHQLFRHASASMSCLRVPPCAPDQGALLPKIVATSTLSLSSGLSRGPEP